MVNVLSYSLRLETSSEMFMYVRLLLLVLLDILLYYVTCSNRDAWIEKGYGPSQLGKTLYKCYVIFFLSLVFISFIH